MTVYKPALTRPIEIENSNTYYRIVYDFELSVTYNIDINHGTYANIAALLRALEVAANATLTAAEGTTVDWSLVEDTTNGVFNPKVTFTNGNTSAKVTPGTELAKILGDPAITMDDSYAAAHTAPYAPSHCWIPRFQKATQDQWWPDTNKIMVGHTMKSGRFVGNKTGSEVVNYLTLKFTNEWAKNIFDQAATTMSSTYDIYANRNLLKFYLESMTWNNQETGHQDGRGFYYYPNWNNLIDSPGIFPGGTDGITTTYEGISYNRSSSTHRFTYCQFDSNPMPKPKTSHPHGEVYYDTPEFQINTIDHVCDWEAPDQVS